MLDMGELFLSGIWLSNSQRSTWGVLPQRDVLGCVEFYSAFTLLCPAPENFRSLLGMLSDITWIGCYIVQGKLVMVRHF